MVDPKAPKLSRHCFAPLALELCEPLPQLAIGRVDLEPRAGLGVDQR